MSAYTVIGTIDSAPFYAIVDALNNIQMDESASSQDVASISSKTYLEAEYEKEKKNLALEYKGDYISHSESVLVYKKDGYYIGGLRQFAAYAKDHLGYTESISPAFFQSVASKAINEKLKTHSGRFVFMDLKIGESKDQRIILELDQKKCPLTTTNFISLCNGQESKLLHYMGSLIHRVVRDGYIQGGDIVASSGADGKSIYGDCFRDECFEITFDEPGVIAMCHGNGNHTNASQFMITVEPLPWMNKQAVAFGKVIKGMDAIKEIANLPTINERPINEVKIVNCGEVDLNL